MSVFFRWSISAATATDLVAIGGAGDLERLQVSGIRRALGQQHSLANLKNLCDVQCRLRCEFQTRRSVELTPGRCGAEPLRFIVVMCLVATRAVLEAVAVLLPTLLAHGQHLGLGGGATGSILLVRLGRLLEIHDALP